MTSKELTGARSALIKAAGCVGSYVNVQRRCAFIPRTDAIARSQFTRLRASTVPSYHFISSPFNSSSRCNRDAVSSDASCPGAAPRGNTAVAAIFARGEHSSFAKPWEMGSDRATGQRSTLVYTRRASTLIITTGAERSPCNRLVMVADWWQTGGRLVMVDNSPQGSGGAFLASWRAKPRPCRS